MATLSDVSPAGTYATAMPTSEIEIRQHFAKVSARAAEWRMREKAASSCRIPASLCKLAAGFTAPGTCGMRLATHTLTLITCKRRIAARKRLQPPPRARGPGPATEKMKYSARLSVGFLTLAQPRGRRADKMLALAGRFGAVPVCALLLATTVLAADDWQPVGDIEMTAERFVDGTLGQAAARSQTRASPLDPRLRLNRCEQPLAASLRTAARSNRQRVVAVSCADAKPWKVYVPVDILSTESVLVTRRALPRGHRLEATDVVSEDRDVSRLNGGYLTTVSELTGQRLKRTLGAGTIVTPSSLQAQTLVRRGQSVTLTVASGDLDIRMAGKALMDGVLNERIRVENLSSQRIVEGLVRSPQTVEVMFR